MYIKQAGWKVGNGNKKLKNGEGEHHRNPFSCAWRLGKNTKFCMYVILAGYNLGSGHRWTKTASQKPSFEQMRPG